MGVPLSVGGLRPEDGIGRLRTMRGVRRRLILLQLTSLLQLRLILLQLRLSLRVPSIVRRVVLLVLRVGRRGLRPEHGG